MLTTVRSHCSSLGCLWILLSLALLPAYSGEVRVYATNSAGDNVHVIDPATNKVVQVIEGIETPHGVDFAPDGTRVYISNEADSTLDVVDRKTGRIVKKVPLSGHQTTSRSPGTAAGSSSA